MAKDKDGVSKYSIIDMWLSLNIIIYIIGIIRSRTFKMKVYQFIDYSLYIKYTYTLISGIYFKRYPDIYMLL